MAKKFSSTTFIYQIVFGLAFLFLAYNAVRIMMFGNMRNFRLIAFFAIAFGVVMWLDKRYWLVLPLCMALGVKIPVLPFDSTEIGCLSFVCIHFLRTALKRDVLAPWNHTLLISLPLFFWICFVWVLNPAGMNILRSFGDFGTASMGGRFYLRILFAFMALCGLSTIRLSANECKDLFRVLLLGAILSILLLFLRPGLYDLEERIGGSIGSRYYLLAFAGMYNILWSRYSISEVLRSVTLMMLISLSALAVVASGKRSSAASIALFPIYRAVLTRKGIGVTLVCGIIAFLLLSTAVAMDGEFIHIPRSAYRSLAMIYPKYRGKGREGLSDTFRTKVHAGARRIIHEHPWMGRRGFRMDTETAVWMYSLGFQGQFSGHIFSGNWHGAFWAFAADFGIPALIFYLFFVWKSLGFAFKHTLLFREGSYQSICFLYYGMLSLHKAVFMFTSGHSSYTTQEGFLELGMMIAIVNGLGSQTGKEELALKTIL